MKSLEKLIQLPYSDIKDLNIGLKAQNLVWMAKKNYIGHIPSFFVVFPKECRAIVDEGEDSLKITKDIIKFATEMNSKHFFVRSSAQVEDKVGLPTAGLFLSLGRVPLKELKEAIEKCILSTRKEKIRKILGFIPATAIIVQNMIRCYSSGVLFSSHPVVKDKSRILIEAGYGMGETVVSGRFNTDHYEISKNNYKILKSEINTKVRYISSESNSVEKVPDH
ncbi:MAG: PEP/pyruvate-binding domain-containing protein, partial [Promethearchaeia archaeon]